MYNFEAEDSKDFQKSCKILSRELEASRKYEKRYEGKMDKECLVLCNALNSIKGVRTTESCCGHSKHAFCVWFDVDMRYATCLNLLSRVLDRNYGGFEKIYGGMFYPVWSCMPACSDIYKKNKIGFYLTSGNLKGPKAYRQSVAIAHNIYNHLENQSYKKAFKIA